MILLIIIVGGGIGVGVYFAVSGSDTLIIRLHKYFKNCMLGFNRL